MAGRVESPIQGDMPVQNPEDFRLLEYHVQTVAYLLLSSPRPGVPYKPGEEVTERRVPERGEIGGSGAWTIALTAEDDARSNEWGIKKVEKKWGRITIEGETAYFETTPKKNESIAYLVNDSVDACPLAEVIGQFSEYTQEQLDSMARRGIKGVIKTRTGVIKHYKEGDSMLVLDKHGITSDTPRWREIPL